MCVLLERESLCFPVEVGRRVAIQSATFCVTYSLITCVVALSGCHAGYAYVSMGLMYCLYTRVMSSLDWPKTLRRVFVLVFMLSVCEVKLFFHMSLRMWWAYR